MPDVIAKHTIRYAMMKQNNKGVMTCADTNALRTTGEAYIMLNV